MKENLSGKGEKQQGEAAKQEEEGKGEDGEGKRGDKNNSERSGDWSKSITWPGTRLVEFSPGLPDPVTMSLLATAHHNT